MLGLRWPDIDSVGRTVRIKRAMSEGKIEERTKTGGSRIVDLTKRLAEALASWQAHLEAEALTSNAAMSEYVFTGLNADDARRTFQSLLRRAGLPKFRLYDLRHRSYASHLLAEGAPLTYVAAQLGHKKPTTTLLYYAHWIPRGDKAWADRLEASRAQGDDMAMTHRVEREA